MPTVKFAAALSRQLVGANPQLIVQSIREAAETSPSWVVLSLDHNEHWVHFSGYEIQTRKQLAPPLEGNEPVEVENQSVKPKVFRIHTPTGRIEAAGSRRDRKWAVDTLNACRLIEEATDLLVDIPTSIERLRELEEFKIKNLTAQEFPWDDRATGDYKPKFVAEDHAVEFLDTHHDKVIGARVGFVLRNKNVNLTLDSRGALSASAHEEVGPLLEPLMRDLAVSV